MEYLKLALPMLVVVIIIVAAYFVTRFIAKKQNSFSSGRIIKIVEQVMVGRDASLAVVKIGEKVYLMSVSSGKTELLTELPLELADKALSERQAPEFKNLLNSFMNIGHGSKDKNNGGDK